jgi:hypothetical protein
MNSDRFVIVIDPQFNHDITEEGLRKFLMENFSVMSFHLTTVPQNMNYTLTAKKELVSS